MFRPVQPFPSIREQIEEYCKNGRYHECLADKDKMTPKYKRTENGNNIAIEIYLPDVLKRNIYIWEYIREF